MKKFRNLRIIGLVVILVVALVLIGMNFVQAQNKGKGKKPPKGPSYTWEMTIVPGGCFEGMGEGRGDVEHGWVYKDSEEFVNISYYVLTYIRTKFKTTDYIPIFRVEVFPGAQIYFDNINKVAGTEGGDPTYTGGFPGGSSLFDFMNYHTHPDTGYTKLLFMFQGGKSQDKEAVDFLNMDNGEERLIHMDMWIIGQGLLSDTSECDPDGFNNIMADAYGWYPNGSPIADLYVTREGTDTWRVVVDTLFDNPDYDGVDYPNVLEYHQGRIYQEYCDLVPVQVNKKKTVLQRQTFRPFWARAYMKFEMVFTRKLVK